MKILDPVKEFSASRPDVALALIPDQFKVSAGINKNLILSEYQEFCIEKGYSNQVYTVVKGKTSQIMAYPTHHHLIADCKMKPSMNLYYRVKDLHFENVVIFLIKWHKLYLTDEDLDNMRNLSKMYREMIDNVLRLRHMNFLTLKFPRFDYADQIKISNERVNLATTCAIHYGLHTGMVIQNLKGEYVGESRDASLIQSPPT